MKPDRDADPGTFQQYALAPANYVTPIPDSLSSEDAAPMLCAGVVSQFPFIRLACGGLNFFDTPTFAISAALLQATDRPIKMKTFYYKTMC